MSAGCWSKRCGRSLATSPVNAANSNINASRHWNDATNQERVASEFRSASGAPRHGEQQLQHRQWRSLLRRVGLLPLSPGEPVQILPCRPQPCPRAFCLGCDSAIPCLAFTPRPPPRNACGELRLRGEYARRIANDTRTHCTRPIRDYPGNQPSQRVYPRPPDTSFDTLDSADGYSRPHRQLRSR